MTHILRHTLLLPLLIHLSLSFTLPLPSFLPPQFSSTSPSVAPVAPSVVKLLDQNYYDRTFNSHVSPGSTFTTYIQKNYPEIFNTLPTKASADQTLTKTILSTLNDKYTRLLPPSQYTAIQKYDLVGIGCLLSPYVSAHPLDDVNEGYICITSTPVGGSTGEKAGLEKGDIILKVNDVSTKGKTAMEIVNFINDGGSTLTMSVKGKGQITIDRKFNFNSKVESNYDVKSSELTIKLKEFNGKSYDDIEDVIKSNSNVKKIIIDLRSNGGGSFQSAIDVASLFLSDKLAATVQDGKGETLPVKTPKNKKIVTDDTLVKVLVDSGTASASEVLTGALRDNCASATQGTRSFGKGLIQGVYGLDDGEGLVITVAEVRKMRMR
ncbi:hypothetical protein TL16_g11677 [Triparma laevis f. inornata]|uniref:PDZ domain-containing protein n=1 Tax=Triparma laevis f. inornata TaxID=1714386 RepID=A0A9W7BPV3_9STRA|nr:hypothetical protein TL16_g11677 [Triparma laevis f. inornata]